MPNSTSLQTEVGVFPPQQLAVPDGAKPTGGHTHEEGVGDGLADFVKNAAR